MSNDYPLFYRRNLPHYQPVNTPLFITFRLAGSLPVEVLQRLHEEYERSIAEIDKILSVREQQEVAYVAQRRAFGRLDAFLDAATTGPYWLEEPAIAQLLANSFHYRFSSDWWGRSCKFAVFNHDVQAKVLKHMVAKSTADGATDGIVESFHDTTGEPFIEVVQELFPPVL